MKEAERNALTARVAADLAQHQYRQLVNENGVEVWRCNAPGSSCYAFDICVTRFGMSIMGVTRSLVFHVGASYGINFLRHKSDGYLYEKLDGDCKREVIDFDAIRDTVCECVAGRIEDELIVDGLPEWITDMPDKGATLEQAEQLSMWLRERGAFDDDRLPFDELAEAIDDVETFADGRDSETVLAYEFLQQHEELIGGSDLWETKISKPCPRVMAKLFYVRHAANAIMALKELAVPAEGAAA